MTAPAPMKAKPKCGSPKRQGDGTCTRPAGWGTDHVGAGRCKLHGGCSPSGKKAAAKQILTATADEMGLSLEVEPHELALATVHSVAGSLAVAQQQVAKMSPEQAAGSFWLEALGQAQDRATRTSKAALDAGIAERRVRLAERTGALIASAAEQAMGEMRRPIPVEDRAEFVGLFQRRLARLEVEDPDEGE
jgi:hypothetical protein